MIDTLDWIRRALGGKADAASATGSANAKAAAHLARFGSTQAGRLDVALSSLMGGFNSIQKGEIVLNGGVSSKTATISSVNLAKAKLISEYTATSPDSHHAARGELTNGTTVTGYQSSTSGNSSVHFAVYEYA